jgi:xanthine dehydrogenase YagS FAD-binding subunit
MNRFEWVDARTAHQASGLATATIADAMITGVGEQPVEQEAVIKAGGLDLLDLMKEDLVRPRRLVNLRAATGLDSIVEDSGGTLRIGSLATLAQVGAHALIRERYAALADAASNSASPQIRHMATLGGNLLQRPRCWYFRSLHHHCVRKGGQSCFAFAGENQYHAIFDHEGCAIVHPSTAATALVAFGAKLELVTAEDIKREVLLEDFFLLPKADIHRENDLRPGEILTAVLLPAMPPTVRSVHLKQCEKDSFDWPLADVAVVLDLMSDGTCRQASVVLGAAAPVPHRAKAAEAAIVGKRICADTARAGGQAALTGSVPLTNNSYKLPIFEALVRRAILAVANCTGENGERTTR